MVSEAAGFRDQLHREAARMMAYLRKRSGLTQQGLAERVGKRQSVISRLEATGYEGHSLSMLNRIARSLNRRVTVRLESVDPAPG